MRAWLPTSRRLGLTLGACVLACACVSEQEIAARSLIAPDSPVAKAIAEARDLPAVYPKFAEIPPLPEDLRSAEVWRQSAGDLDTARQGLDRSLAANPPLTVDTEAFLREAAARAGADAPTEDSTAAAEAFRRQGIERATPPPMPR